MFGTKLMRTDNDEDRISRIKRRAIRQVELTARCKFSADKTAQLKDEELSRKTQFFVSFDRDEAHGQHLLSEGVVVDGDGDPYAIIGKNAISEWYDSLDETAVHPIDLAHETHNPIFKTIGQWTKNDLELVTNPDGRHSLYVKNLNLDEDSLVVKELRRREDVLALSVEFYSDIGYVDFEDQYVTLHVNLDIIGFAIVVEPQDALSGGLELHNNTISGESTMKKTKLAALLQEAFGFTEDDKTKLGSAVSANGVNKEPAPEPDPEPEPEPGAEDIVEVKGDDAEPESEPESEPELEPNPDEDDDEEVDISAKEVAALVSGLSLVKDQLAKQAEFNASVSESLAKFGEKLDTLQTFNIAAATDSAKINNSTVKF